MDCHLMKESKMKVNCLCLSCNALLPYDDLWQSRKKQHVGHHKYSIKSKNKIWCSFPMFQFVIGGDDS